MTSNKYLEPIINTENGKLQFEGFYENGRQKDVSKVWNENGDLISEKFYFGFENDI